MKDMIISEKAKEEKMLSEGIANTSTAVKVARISSFINLAGRYNWAMSNIDLNVAKKLGLTSIKKYWRSAGQIEIELDGLHDWIPILATFVRHSRRLYDNEKIG